MAVVTVGLCGLCVSSLVKLLLPALDRLSARLLPRAAARLWRSLAFVPWSVASAVLWTVFVQVPCHCVAHGTHHPHLCLEHSPKWPTLSLSLLVAVIMLRWGLAAMKAGRHVSRSREVRERLESASDSQDRGVWRVPGSSPWAVTLGMLRPQIFLTEAMASDSDTRIVRAHERAHADGRHDLWQCVVSIAAASYLPGVGAAISRRVALSHEMTADEAAARAVGDRTRVAAALVRLARRNGAEAAGGLAFTSSPLETRVRSLLARPRPVLRGRRATAWALASALCVAAAIGAVAGPLHHGLETFFGLLG